MFPGIIEHIGTKYTPLKLERYAKSLNNNDEFYYQVNECLLEYNLIDNIKINPIHRLAYTMISSAVMVHQINTMKDKEIVNKTLNKVNEDIKNKYNSL